MTMSRGKTDRHRRLAVCGDVQDHVDVVEFARGVFDGAADTTLASARIATGNKNVETALEATDLRRRALGLANESHGVALTVDAVERDSADGGTTHQQHSE